MAGTAPLARLRSTRARRLAIALFAVPAIVIGLLAMHVLTTTDVSDPSAPAAAAHHGSVKALEQAVAVSPGMPAPAEDCGGLCGPIGHDMLTMICGLALLITIVLLTLHLILLRWEELRQAASVLAAKAAALAPPEPPSLHVLSISRT